MGEGMNQRLKCDYQTTCEPLKVNDDHVFEMKPAAWLWTFLQTTCFEGTDIGGGRGGPCHVQEHRREMRT